DGQPCDKCAGGNFSHAVINRCKKGSLGASLIAAMECSLFPPKKLSEWVTRFICPSRFLADILVKHGIPVGKVTNVPNFLPSLSIEPNGSDYFLYVGRLSPEKGVDTLLEAFHRVGRGKLIVAGDGPMRSELENKAATLSSCDVEFVGQQSQQAVFHLLSNSLATVAPSTCWENFPFTVLEAMAAQKPVIASRTGGMVEQVEHNRTGLLVEPGNVTQLAEQISHILDNPHLARQMGAKGYARVMSEYGPEKHYERIIQVYNEAIDNLNYGARESRRRVIESPIMGAESR
ncbi:MAG: glycosyltransferase family 4 protein, partial [candidate division Zixibacteria bacterium]